MCVTSAMAKSLRAESEGLKAKLLKFAEAWDGPALSETEHNELTALAAEVIARPTEAAPVAKEDHHAQRRPDASPHGADERGDAGVEWVQPRPEMLTRETSEAVRILRAASDSVANVRVFGSAEANAEPGRGPHVAVAKAEAPSEPAGKPKTDCSVAGCGDLARTYGLCFAHARAAGRDATHAEPAPQPPAAAGGAKP